MHCVVAGFAFWFGFLLSAVLFRRDANNGRDIFNPAIILLGILAGYLANRNRRDKVSIWVWVAGAVWFCIMITWECGNRGDMSACVIQEFLSPFNVCSGSECMGVLFSTYPLLTTIAYSIGAASALALGNKKAEEFEE